MTDRLEEIRKRCDAATPGPWLESLGDVRDANGETLICTDCGLYPAHANDAKFMAHSREDIPYLLSELEKAKKLSNPITLD